MYHINPQTGNPGKCSAKPGNCPYGAAGEHFETKSAAQQEYEFLMSHGDDTSTLFPAQRRLLEKWKAGSIAREEISAKRTNLKKAKRNYKDFLEKNKYPSPSNPEWKKTLDELKSAQDAHIRATVDIPDDWKIKTAGPDGATYLPSETRTGPNGSLLQVSYTSVNPRSDYMKDPQIKQTTTSKFYAVTSANVYIAGPFDTAKESTDAILAYNGPTSPGPIGWD